ncbi:MAG: hypothetical protein KTR13_01625 [Saprospiraceae bacterium]|nr:hypothetical protein [Saprospiraceae bacterium]
MKLKEAVQALEANIPHRDALHTAVSAVTVAWHIDHSLKVINGITHTLKHSDVTVFKGNYSVFRMVLFALDYLPRGRAKSPKRVLPPEEIITEALYKQVEQARQSLVELEAIPVKANFRHHIFGVLNKKQSIRMMEVHSKHHLKIIRDILKA